MQTATILLSPSPSYTKELVSQAFHVLNTTTDPEQRRQCNQFLTEFQVSKFLLISRISKVNKAGKYPKNY